MSINSLRKLIKSTGRQTGIYIFKDKRGKSLYIGKASNLKTRLLSYLKTTDQRIVQMLSRATGIKTLETGSEIEALILESQYVKKYKPAFNIMLRDDKQFFYVGITKEIWPKIFLTHQPIKKRGSAVVGSNGSTMELASTALMPTALQPEFVGPFTDGTALKTTLRHLRRIFPYCTCKKPHNNFCLNYHIGKCLGICCLKNISYDAFLSHSVKYKKNIKAIRDILSGKKTSLLKGLEKEMVKLGKEERFDEAIELRNKIEKIKRVFENARVIQTYDTSKYHKQSPLSDLKNILKLKKPPVRIEGYDIANIQGKYAVGAMVVFENGVPNKNEYRKFEVRGVGNVRNDQDANSTRTSRTSKAIQQFEQPGGDVGMLKEVLTRRFNHTEWPLPDLIVVDGGKAQLNAVRSVIYNLQFTIYKQTRPNGSSGRTQNSKFKIPIIALTKDEKHKGTKIFVQNKKESIPLSKLPAAVKNLLLHIDSEAHRFAISYYRRTHRRALK